MNKIQMVDLRSQYLEIKDQVDEEINKVLENTAFINGPVVKEFAAQLGDYLNCENVVPCANGTDALQIAIMACDFPRESEILVSTFNYVAAAETIALMGHKPVFIEADEEYFNLDPEKIEEKITDKTRAIVSVHLFGQSSKMERLQEICKKHNLLIIEDNAQGIGGTYEIDGKVLSNGTIGDIATTSFFPSKNLGCFGDGGAIYSKRTDLFEKSKKIANHGQRVKYDYDAIGVNSRLDSMQAAILKVKLTRLDEYISKRNKAAQMYNERLGNIENLILPKVHDKASHVFHQYTMKVGEGRRDELKSYLADKGIPSMIYYPKPLHKNDAYIEFANPNEVFHIAEKLSASVLSLPMHTELGDDQVDYICDSVRDFFKN